jgi:hypothetical protein
MICGKQTVGLFTYSIVNCFLSYCRQYEDLNNAEYDALLWGGWFLAF